MIDQGAVRGEKDTGFEKRGDKGPFECGNCQHFSQDRCNQKDMMAKSEQPHAADGTVIVDAADCCEYVGRIGPRDDRKTRVDLEKAGSKAMKKWIQKAVPKSRKGVFGAKAAAAGESTAEYAQDKSSAPGTLGKEARLAKTLMGLRKKKKGA